MHHIVVGETAHDVGDGVGLADVREELIAEALALGGAGDQPGDVHELHRARHHPRRAHDRGKLVEPWIGHGHDAGIRFDGTERKVLALTEAA